MGCEEDQLDRALGTRQAWSRLAAMEPREGPLGPGGHAGGTRSRSSGLDGSNTTDSNKDVRRGMVVDWEGPVEGRRLVLRTKVRARGVGLECYSQDLNS